MKGGTLLVSRHTHLLPMYKTLFEQWGYSSSVSTTDKEKDALNMYINEVKPRFVLFDSCFYQFATPYMLGQLVAAFPALTVGVVTLNCFPDELAMWFIFYGVKNYIKLTDGLEEFHRGLRCMFSGKEYVSPAVKSLINTLPELPDVKKRADKRQFEVLVMLCNGNSPEDIARCLHITRRTVDWHIDALKSVFNVHTREQLLSMAFYLEVVRKEDMCFFARKAKKVVMPQWRIVC